jgi:malonyl-CoA O-methyltransferase
MVWSNLALHWMARPQQAFAEIYRVLRPGAVCMFSTFGPDTLRELRASFALDTHEHVSRFIDLHDVGDMLVHARFADPVMDMEYLTLTYPDARALMRELKATGARNASAARNPAMTGKHAFARAIDAYEQYRRAGRLPATFEVVYGHAWRPARERQTADGRAVIDFRARPGSA